MERQGAKKNRLSEAAHGRDDTDPQSQADDDQEG